MASVELKIDNLDARNMRQLNQLYAEIKTVQDMLSDFQQPGSRKNKSSIRIPRLVNEQIEPSIAVLVIACNRVEYVKQTLDELLKHRPSAGLFPIIVSQDCGHQPTSDAIASYGARITHIKHPDLSNIEIPAQERKIKNKVAEVGYYKIARHFKWALTQVFEEMNHEYVIVVEDDLIIAPDFYMYFAATWPLLNFDPSIMCVSAYADNGKMGYINMKENEVLYRTDFFPGLGWMLKKKLWLELKPKWPLTFWDDWLREPEQRKNRVCIRPEVSRTKTIGKKGVSIGAYFTQHLQHIVLNSNPVDFTQKNLTYIMKETYDQHFITGVEQLPLVSLQQVLQGTVPHDAAKIQYSSDKDFEKMAGQLKLMSDLRAGVPRTAYKGIVSFMYKNKRIHLVPPKAWQGYTSHKS